MAWAGQPDMSVQGDRDADGNLTIEGYERLKKSGFKPIGTAGEDWWKLQTRLYEDRTWERKARSTVNIPDPTNETTGIAPPDTFQPFLREMQRRVSDRSLLSTSGRDRMMEGRQFSAPAPTPAPVMRAPTLPQRTPNSRPDLHGQQNMASPGLGLFGGSLNKPGAGIKFRPFAVLPNPTSGRRR